MLDEGDDAPLVAKIVVLARALVADMDPQARIQERKFPKPLGEHVERKIRRLEDLGVRRKRDARPGVFRGPDLLDARSRLTSLVGLAPDLLISSDFEFEVFRERVDDRDTDPVEAARNLVGLRVEFPPRVQGGQHDFGCGALLGRVDFNRDAPAIIDYRNAVVLVDGDLDCRAESRHRFVDRIIDDFVNKMVQSVRSGGSDIHRRTFSYRVEALENLNGSGVIGAQMNLFLAWITLRWDSLMGAQPTTHRIGGVRVLNG